MRSTVDEWLSGTAERELEATYEADWVQAACVDARAQEPVPAGSGSASETPGAP